MNTKVETPVQAPARDVHDPWLGRVMNGLRFEGLLGFGSCGRVYQAEQLDPGRKVAVKMMPSASLDEAVRARFEMEQLALASLDHRHIPRVYQSGTTREGMPYLVLELVKGVPINTYCDEHRLGIKARLELFEQLGRAVAHAHAKGVVHCDIKSDHALVMEENGVPVVKLIDFGISKVFKGYNDTSHHVLGSLSYCSPEQAGLRDAGGHHVELDLRTDIYSLGVVLFELLVGQRPLCWPKDAGIKRILQEICEMPPPGLVQALRQMGGEKRQTVAAARAATPVALMRGLRNEPEWILTKALQKHPNDRYQTVESLVDDIAHLRDGRPVAVMPTTMRFLLRRGLRRYHLQVTVGVTVAVALLVALLAYFYGFVEKSRETRRQHQIAEQVAGFLQDLFVIPDADSFLGTTITAREVLDRGNRSLLGLAMDGELRARLEWSLGRVYDQLGVYETAKPLLERAVENQSGQQHPTPALYSSLVSLALVELHRAEYGPSADHYRQAMDMAAKLHDEHRMAKAMAGLAEVKRHQNDVAQTESLLMQALELVRAHPGDAFLEAEIQCQLGLFFNSANNHERAIAHFQTALKIVEDSNRPNHPKVAEIMTHYGHMQQWYGNFQQAESLLTKALSMRERVLGENHPDTIMNLSYLGALFGECGEYDKAEPLLLTALARSEKALGEKHPFTASQLYFLGKLAGVRGDFSLALNRFRQSQNFWRGMHGVHHLEALRCEREIGTTLWSMGRFDEAESMIRDLVAETDANRPELTGAYFSILLGMILKSKGDEDGAFSYLESAIHFAQPVFYSHPIGAELKTHLGELLVNRGQWDEAEANIEEGLQIYLDKLGRNHWRTGEALTILGHYSVATGELEIGRRLLLEGLEIMRQIKPDHDLRVCEAIWRAADAGVLLDWEVSSEWPVSAKHRR